MITSESKDMSYGIWIRVSTIDQANGESPEVHEKRARLYAEAKGWDIATVYHLEGVSGKAVKDHPETQRMLKDIAEGTIHGLIFSKLARLARNTKELLEFSEYFKVHAAHLISLQESIDTSSPSGRLFYTLIAAMAQWEREEIAERVAASVPIRAKLGKSLGGKAPYGYRSVDGKLELDPIEAPIRKLMFEYYRKHKRKRRVATLLNEAGYRTRTNKLFTYTTVSRLLADPIAKGMRRVNYTTSEDGKVVQKPKEDWVFRKVPAIVSEELWEEVNAIANDKSDRHRKNRKTKALFSGLVECQCGTKMYPEYKSPKYVCRSCRNKIGIEILEEIFHSQLKEFFLDSGEMKKQFEKAQEKITDREHRLHQHQRAMADLRHKTSSLIDLYSNNELSKEEFREHHNPIKEQLGQLEEDSIKLQSEIDVLKVNSLSQEEIVNQSVSLHDKWKTIPKEEKREIVENIVRQIIIKGDEVTINVWYSPSPSPKMAANDQRKDMHSGRK
jgi:site-specific DNA recombinase